MWCAIAELVIGCSILECPVSVSRRGVLNDRNGAQKPPLAKPASSFGERVPAGDEAFVDDLVRQLKIVFSLELAVEPSSKVSERFCNGLLSA